MTEFNNKIQKIGVNNIDYNKKPLDTSKKGSVAPECEKSQDEIKDTGVLGHSLINKTSGSNISKTVEETAEIAKHEGVLYGCETVFDTLYKSYLAQGCSESEAYMNATLGEEEFKDLALNLANR